MRRVAIILAAVLVNATLAIGAENDTWVQYDGTAFSGVIFSFRLNSLTLYEDAGVQYVRYQDEEDGHRLSSAGNSHTREFVKRVLARYKTTIGGVLAKQNRADASRRSSVARGAPSQQAGLLGDASRHRNSFTFLVVTFRADDDELVDLPYDLLSDEHRAHPHLQARLKAWYSMQARIDELKKQLTAARSSFPSTIRTRPQVQTAPPAERKKPSRPSVTTPPTAPPGTPLCPFCGSALMYYPDPKSPDGLGDKGICPNGHVVYGR